MKTPPLSPYNMLQEQQLGKPFEKWRILVCCMLLNQTHGRQVRPMIDEFFLFADSPQEFLDRVAIDHQMNHMLAMLRPLGFKNRRLGNLIAMSKDMVEIGDPAARGFRDAMWVKAVRGCGPYAHDSIAIFCYGADQNVSSDTWLNDYIGWRKAWHKLNPK